MSVSFRKAHLPRGRLRLGTAPVLRIVVRLLYCALSCRVAVGMRHSDAQDDWANASKMLNTSAISLYEHVGALRLQSLGWSFLEVKTRTQSSATDLLDIISNPDHILLFFYLFVLFRGLLKAWMGHGSAVTEKMAEAQRHRDELEDSYEDTVKSSEQMLLGMFESSAYVAEWNFQTRARNFEKFIEHMKAHPNRLLVGSSTEQAATKNWCRFLILWFEVFEQCSVSPIKEPNKLTSPVDITKTLKKIRDTGSKGPGESWLREFVTSAESAAKVIAANEINFKAMFQKAIAKFEYAEKMQARMRGSPPCWMRLGAFKVGMQATPLHAAVQQKSDIGQFKDETDDYPVDIYFGFIHITILSLAHFLLLFNVFVCSVLVGLEVWLEKTIAVAFLVVSMFFLICGLFRIGDVDEYARLVQELRELTQASELLNLRHQKLDKFCKKLRKLDHLWRSRTLPCLELFGEICIQLQDMPEGENRPQFLEEVVAALERMNDGLGNIDSWMVGDNESAEFLELAGQEMHLVTQFIIAARHEHVSPQEILKRVQRTFGVLIIRVKSATELTNKTTFGFAGQIGNPYVTVKTNIDNEQVTNTLESCLNPVWDEEFCIPVMWNDDMLELHVWSNNSKGVNLGEDPSLGYVHVSFRDFTAATWHTNTAHLKSVKKGTEKKSELKYEFYFADSVRQLFENET